MMTDGVAESVDRQVGPARLSSFFTPAVGCRIWQQDKNSSLSTLDLSTYDLIIRHKEIRHGMHNGGSRHEQESLFKSCMFKARRRCHRRRLHPAIPVYSTRPSGRPV